MKKILTLVLCAVLITVFASGCVTVNLGGGTIGFGNSVTGVGSPEIFEFQTGDITSIRIFLFCDIDYYSAPSDRVTLEIQPNLMEYVSVEAENGVLTVSSSRSISWTGGSAPLLTVSSPSLEAVEISGAGTFNAIDTITVPSFTINFAGAGNAIAALDVDKLTIDVSGAGSAELSGRADTANLTLSGAGSIRALPLETKDAKITLAGAGSVKLSCSDNLDVSASGAGSVEYRGNPNTSIIKSGVVTVKQVD